jgi:hypothetical protein
VTEFSALVSGRNPGLNSNLATTASRMDKDEEGAVEQTEQPEQQQDVSSKTLLERIAPDATGPAPIGAQETRGPSPEKTEVAQSEASHSEKPQDGQSRAPSPSRNRKPRGGRGRRRSPGPPLRPPSGIPHPGYRDGRRGRSRGKLVPKVLLTAYARTCGHDQRSQGALDALTTRI